MALRAGYYGVKRFLRNKLETIAGTYDDTIKSLFPRSEQAVLGAKNRFNFNEAKTVSSGVTLSGTYDNFTIANLVAAEWKSVIWDVKVEKNTNYTVSFDADYTSGKGFVNVSDSTKQVVLGQIQDNILSNRDNITFNFNSGNDTTVKLALFVAMETAVAGNITYKNLVIKLATDTDPTYAPYAMTNRELTDSAADQKTAINAIITAATGAADFAAFKTAMGAITPVTRSLSLTKEDITEEVKEDVEPEKTVTKKRTTKKTEEV